MITYTSGGGGGGDWREINIIKCVISPDLAYLPTQLDDHPSTTTKLSPTQNSKFIPLIYGHPVHEGCVYSMEQLIIWTVFTL